MNIRKYVALGESLCLCFQRSDMTWGYLLKILTIEMKTEIKKDYMYAAPSTFGTALRLDVTR